MTSITAELPDHILEAHQSLIWYRTGPCEIEARWLDIEFHAVLMDRGSHPSDYKDQNRYYWLVSAFSFPEHDSYHWSAHVPGPRIGQLSDTCHDFIVQLLIPKE